MAHPLSADGAESRVVLRVFAWVYGAAGLATMLWGLVWPPGVVPDVRLRVAAMAGAIALAAASVAWGMASVPDSRIRRDLLGWFVIGHGTFIFVASAWQLDAFRREDPLIRFTAYLALGVAFVLLSRHPHRVPESMQLTTLFGRRNVPMAHLRTAYEQQIREAASLEERHRLARDLHDSIKQQVFVIQTAAATAQTRFDEDPDGARSALDQVRAAGREAMAEMDAMLDQLRANALENTGLVEALKRHCEALGFRTGADVSFRTGALPPSEALRPGAHQAILRVAQEALANVGRHARARHVWVILEAGLRSVTLVVKDDGVGSGTTPARAGMGLSNMRARAEEFGGTLGVSTSAGAGTTIRLDVPHTAGVDVEELQGRRRSVVWWFLATAAALLSIVALKLAGLVDPLALLPVLAITVARLVHEIVDLRRARRLKDKMPWAQPPSPSSTTTV